jgi:hypothetical protein
MSDRPQNGLAESDVVMPPGAGKKINLQGAESAKSSENQVILPEED